VNGGEIFTWDGDRARRSGWRGELRYRLLHLLRGPTSDRCPEAVLTPPFRGLRHVLTIACAVNDAVHRCTATLAGYPGGPIGKQLNVTRQDQGDGFVDTTVGRGKGGFGPFCDSRDGGRKA
jgi:hypothetical protein